MINALYQADVDGVSDEKAPEQLSASEEEQVKRRETELWTSDKIAQHKMATYGRSQIAFVIGQPGSVL